MQLILSLGLDATRYFLKLFRRDYRIKLFRRHYRSRERHRTDFGTTHFSATGCDSSIAIFAMPSIGSQPSGR
jgi:hypothetical protein